MVRLSSFTLALLIALSLVLSLVLGMGCGTDRRRSLVDSSVALDGSGPGDSGPAGDADLDSAIPLDSAAPFDGAPTDSGGRVDSGTPDTGVRDSGVRDTGTPDTGTPDTGPAPTTIADIQRGTVPEGTTVTLSDMSVTGIYELGAWVQDPALGPAYSGVRVYVGLRPTVSIGDRVDFTGSILEYYGDTEIEATTFTRRGPGTPLAPVNVTVAQAVSEPYEGVLVRLTDASSYLSFYDCTADNPACTDTDVWRVSSTAANVLVHDYLYEDADWLSHVGDLRITGVASYRYDNRRIMPRRSVDFAP
ncbi:MAG: hypothetical protein DRJ42_14505 [Deltaproteobacteria bacterium]|nr:MAG: hypothetical protein DRJ42_14505 [Deltaproteobacteria bacterium]